MPNARYTLAQVPTRKLMAAMGNFHSWSWHDEVQSVVHTFVGKGGVLYPVMASLNDMRGELAKRPHVASRREAAKIRQLKARTGMTEADLRAHPKFGQEIASAGLPSRRLVSPRDYAFLERMTTKQLARRLWKIKPRTCNQH